MLRDGPELDRAGCGHGAAGGQGDRAPREAVFGGRGQSACPFPVTTLVKNLGSPFLPRGLGLDRSGLDSWSPLIHHN